MNSEYFNDLFLSLINANRMPQAVIIEGGTKELRAECATYLSAYAVCKSETRPCFSCNACKKSIDNIHPDIITPIPEGKTKIIPAKLLREKYLPHAYTVSNEANTKVFIFNDADETLTDITENTLLKIIEEPPLSILFIFTCEKANSLLQTIRSRSQIFKLKNDSESEKEISEISKSIAKSIVSSHEINLLKDLATLTQKDNFKEAMLDLSEILRRALNISCGVKCDDDTASELASKLTKVKILALIDATKTAIEKSQRNINMTLLCTQLCTQYRRISWQR